MTRSTHRRRHRGASSLILLLALGLMGASGVMASNVVAYQRADRLAETAADVAAHAAAATIASKEDRFQFSIDMQQGKQQCHSTDGVKVDFDNDLCKTAVAAAHDAMNGAAADVHPLLIDIRPATTNYYGSAPDGSVVVDVHVLVGRHLPVGPDCAAAPDESTWQSSNTGWTYRYCWAFGDGAAESQP